MFLPNMWGQGAIFAFSGIDGETSYKNDFVGLLEDEFDIVFHLKTRRKLIFNLPPVIRDLDSIYIYNAINGRIPKMNRVIYGFQSFSLKPGKG